MEQERDLGKGKTAIYIKKVFGGQRTQHPAALCLSFYELIAITEGLSCYVGNHLREEFQKLGWVVDRPKTDILIVTDPYSKKGAEFLVTPFYPIRETSFDESLDIMQRYLKD